VLAQATSGTVRVAGANASSAVITVQGSNYSVVITSGGKAITYLVAR
jgi:hypothetical protein